ncbi:PLAT/LH2 domain protein [Gemmata obscuriglobus]|nr:PLAT/LH2 domain protein [Gemmata obscuriglobus]VTS09656.1 m12a family peptidase : Uncharacterized protein OS=Deinococcus deserti (strain VCD115 / DSM 17065 / LMG 22923) GN=Deide_3p00830 PE=4 SV=1: PLAT [Gemmata obscuriglobus UQM 2246]
MFRHVYLSAVAVCILPFASQPALAWKPKTHVYLAEEAMKDANDDGLVTFYEVDPTTNQLRKGVDGKPVKIGDYMVDPRILEALRRYPDQFRAGVLGPDAFPDILTGQQIIHPAGKLTTGETGVDVNKNGPGPDPWLRHLWVAAYTGKGPDATPATRAFVAGFLAHAAGDLYGHTCVNYYTGDAFNFQTEPKNAIRHIVVEGYFDKYVPAPTYKTSIGDGVDGFIHRQMIAGRPGTPLAQLLTGDNVKLTLAAQFTALRNTLYADVRATAIPTPLTWYQKAWIADIDAGLEKLPKVSHELALALMFNPTGKADLAKAREILDAFKPALMSMAGLPDAVGKTVVAFETVAKALGLVALQDFIKQVKLSVLNHVTKSATGLTAEELAKALLADATEFDKWMDQPPLDYGKRITRKEFDEKELKLDPKGGWIDYRRVPPAYNTVAMIKLSFLAKDEVNRLMAKLGAPAGVLLTEDNAMLGFAETLDGSNQWRVNDKQMVIARYPAGYGRVFMKQNGEDRPTNPKVLPGALNVDYVLTIKTSDKSLAGTDAGVFVTIVGKDGSTGEHKLNDLVTGNAFERNQTDTCTLKNVKDVGELSGLTVRSDGKNPAAGWHLEYITVARKGRPTVRFDCNQWLEDDKLSKTLKPKP